MPNRIQPSPVAPRTPPAEAPGFVTVRPGDTLGAIARRMGVTTEALVQANVGRYPGLATNPNAIQAGWTLAAPGAASNGTPVSGPGAWRPGGGGATSGAGSVTGTAVRPNDFGTKLAAGGAQSIELRMRRHLDSIEKTGVGVYYGDHSAWKSMDANAKKEWIEANLKPGATPPPVSSIKENSCIGWALENLGAAYAAAGKSERWNEIRQIVISKGSKGIDLAKELKKDGWQAIYWNPDTRNPSDGNPEHSFTALQVSRGNGYYGVAVDAQVVNYRPTEGKGTKQDMSGIEKLRQVPFFFGLARGGTHTFVGRNGEVNEFHWAEMPNSTRAIEQTPLEKFGWNSGLIMVPPGTWPTN
jgi:hypothetical protein